jgi:hypothetical protein
MVFPTRAELRSIATGHLSSLTEPARGNLSRIKRTKVKPGEECGIWKVNPNVGKFSVQTLNKVVPVPVEEFQERVDPVSTGFPGGDCGLTAHAVRSS